MTTIKMYDLIKQLLIDSPKLRNSDKYLIWAVWFKMGLITQHGDQMTITFNKFLDAPTPETITRCRRQVQEDNQMLVATNLISTGRAKKENTKGKFVYQERINI